MAVINKTKTRKPANENFLPEVNVAQVAIGSKFVDIRLPLNVAEKLGLNIEDEQLLYCLTGDTLQLSKSAPSLTIPAMTDASDFIKHPGED